MSVSLTADLKGSSLYSHKIGDCRKYIVVKFSENGT